MQEPLINKLSDFLDSQRLPADLLPMMQDYYLPLAERLRAVREGKTTGPLLLGINGAQGSGKSAMAAALAIICRKHNGWHVATLSLDDLYLGRIARQRLAQKVHPLLATRGVPGTHDVQLGLDLIGKLRSLEDGCLVHLPRFDKAADDVMPEDAWPAVGGPPDLLIIEGWCLGAPAQAEEELTDPVNDLEHLHDADGRWRRYVNDQLAGLYQSLFDELDYLVFLQVPDMDAVLRWRTEQEEKLRLASASKVMGSEDMIRFVQCFERLTQHQIAIMPDRSDVVFTLDLEHRISHSTLAE